VPLMPEKRLVGNQGKAFIDERMAGLENFVLLLLANPYMRNDATLRMFFSLKGVAEFEQAKKATQAGQGADPASNGGLARWFGVLRHLTLPVDADAACRELAAHSAEMEAKLIGALGAVTRYYETAKALSDALKGVRDSFADFHAGCTATAAALSGTLAPVAAATTELGARLKKTTDVFSNAHDLSVFSPNEIQIFLLDGLVSEVHRVRGIRALLDVREAAQKEYAAAWQGQDRLAFQEKAARDKGRGADADKLAVKVAEAVQLMKRMKERLDDVSKGALNIEGERLARTRIDRVVAMAGQFAALSIASGVRGQELWTAYLSSMELNQEAQVRDAQQTLMALMSMHALDATGPAVAYVLPGAVCANAAPIAINSLGDGAAGAAAPASPGAGAAGSAAAAPAPAAASAGATFTGTATSAPSDEKSVDL